MFFETIHIVQETLLNVKKRFEKSVGFGKHYEAASLRLQWCAIEFLHSLHKLNRATFSQDYINQNLFKSLGL